MDVTTIAQAVTTLQQQGKPVSVRNVRRLTGGSLRDISRLLRELRPPLLQRPPVSAETLQTTEEPPLLSLAPEAARAMQAYHEARQAYEEARARDWKRMPMAPDVVLVPLWRQAEALKRRCLVLGVDLGETDTQARRLTVLVAAPTAVDPG